jgi:predicted DNA-binding transcriptional regulator AlpA
MATPLSVPHLLRLPQIIGRKATATEPAIPALIPIAKSAWWEGIKEGRFPPPIKLSRRAVAWRSEDIAAVIAGTWPSSKQRSCA